MTELSFFHAASSVKLNGKRCTLAFFDGGVFLCAPPEDIFKLGAFTGGWNNTLFDAEFMDNHVYIIDIMVDGGKDVRKMVWEERQKLLDRNYGELEKIPLFAFN